MMLATVLTWAAAGLAGALAHEVAHWLVWRLTGRDPALHPWKLIVRPRAGPTATTAGDRLAAAAPYALGLGATVYGVAVGSWPLIYFGVFTFQIPSRSDVSTVLGRTKWAIEPRPEI